MGTAAIINYSQYNSIMTRAHAHLHMQTYCIHTQASTHKE